MCVLQDDEGREVALKIDRLDSKKCTPETATKSYIEVHTLSLFSEPLTLMSE